MKQKCDHVFYSCVIKLYTNMNKRNVIVLFFDIKNGMNIEFWIENERRQYGH